ncbi:TPA: host cell division inhibitor Icd-like protein [Escherichia coli]
MVALHAIEWRLPHAGYYPYPKPQFIWIIAAVRRDCPTITAKIHHIAAESERDARRSLVRDHVCFFAGRIRMEVAHD